MVVAILFVKWPSKEMALKYDNEFEHSDQNFCVREAEFCWNLMAYLLISHVGSMVMTFKKEISGAKVSAVKSFLEIIILFMIYQAIFLAFSQVTVWNILRHDID
jgi:hypothetical protein